MKSIATLLSPLAALGVALGASWMSPARADDAIDVQKVMSAKGCLGCHSREKKIVGPAFHDVALKYAGNAQAAAMVAANIRAGGVGRWGPVPMPPMRTLTDAELEALADFVLKQ